MSEFPINTIIAWIINDYHEQGNIIIITNLLLFLGHISNTHVDKIDYADEGNISFRLPTSFIQICKDEET